MATAQRERRSEHPGKPGYSLTRQAFWVSFVLAWAVILVILGGALYEKGTVVELAYIVVPSMVALIIATLGVHRAFGAVDMRTLYTAPRRRRSEEAHEGSEQ